MGFASPILGGEDLIRSAVRSPNYLAGSAGWRIAQDGSAEFNNVTIRGTLAVGSITGDLVMGTGGRIMTAAAAPRIILSSSLSSTIQFPTGDAAETNIPYILESVQGSGGQHSAYMALSSGQLSSRGDAYLQLNSGRQDGGVQPYAQFWARALGPHSLPLMESNGGGAIIGSGVESGVIVASGTSVGTTNGGGGLTISYPSAFPHGVYTVLVCNGDAQGLGADDWFVTIVNVNVSTSSFEVVINDSAGNRVGSSAVRVNWVAFGW